MNLYSSSVQCRAKFTPVEWYLAVAVAWFSTLTKSRNLWRGVPVSSFVLPLQGWYDKTHGARLPQEPSWIQLTQHGKSIFYSQLKRELILWQTCEMFVYWSEFLWLKHPASQISQHNFCVPVTLLPHRISARLGYENMKRSVFWCFFGLEKFDPDPEWPRYFMIFPQTECWLPCFSCDFQGTLGWLEQSMQLQSPESWYLTDGAENWDLPSQLCQRCALMPKYAKLQSEIQASTSRDIQCPDAARKLGRGLVGFKQMGDNSQTQCPRLPPAKHGAMFS